MFGSSPGHSCRSICTGYTPMDNIMSTSSINLRNQPGELEKVELQQVQTRLLSAMFRRHDITQRECGWDDTAMT
jgi:hypothetical protein